MAAGYLRDQRPCCNSRCGCRYHCSSGCNSGCRSGDLRTLHWRLSPWRIRDRSPRLKGRRVTRYATARIPAVGREPPLRTEAFPAWMTTRQANQTGGMAQLSPACRNDLEAIAVPRHSSWDPLGLMAVRSHVRHQLAALGQVEEQRFRDGSHEGVNLILKLAGRNPRRRPLLIGAHYDGPLNSTGADDNASAVAALLELGRRWSTAPPRRPVWLVAFDLEEWGLLGSAALAEQLRAEQQRLKLMVSLEMLAYTSDNQSYPHPAMGRVYGNRGDFIALVANARAGLMLSRLTLAMGQHVKTRALPVPRAGIDVPAVRRSDHSPFWDRGYNALMVTDTSFMRNPHYHQMSDTIDTLDLPFLASVINGLEVALGTL